jgi:hypothetical protein
VGQTRPRRLSAGAVVARPVLLSKRTDSVQSDWGSHGSTRDIHLPVVGRSPIRTNWTVRIGITKVLCKAEIHAGRLWVTRCRDNYIDFAVGVTSRQPADLLLARAGR